MHLWQQHSDQELLRNPGRQPGLVERVARRIPANQRQHLIEKLNGWAYWLNLSAARRQRNLASSAPVPPPHVQAPEILGRLVGLTVVEPQAAICTFLSSVEVRVSWRWWCNGDAPGRLWAVQYLDGQIGWAGWEVPEWLMLKWFQPGLKIVDAETADLVERWRLRCSGEDPLAWQDSAADFCADAMVSRFPRGAIDSICLFDREEHFRRAM